MSTPPATGDHPTSPALPAPTPMPAAAPRFNPLQAIGLLATLLLSVLALLCSVYLWNDARHMRDAVARQVADVQLQAREAATLAHLSTEQGKESARRLATLDSKVADTLAQKAQIDAALSSLTHARDDSVLAEIDAAVQLGVQQTQVTGSIQPLLTALLGAQKRLDAANHPQWVGVRQAVLRDIDRVKRASVTDTPLLLGKIDAVLGQIDKLPLQADRVPTLSSRPARAAAAAATPASAPAASGTVSVWNTAWQSIRTLLGGLVRVRTLDASPHTMWLEPQQAFYLRENLKLRLLNARMGLLARMPEASRSDVLAARAQTTAYFDTASPAVQAAVAQLDEVQQHIYHTDMPAIADTLGALASARHTQTAVPAAPAATPVPAPASMSTPAPALRQQP